MPRSLAAQSSRSRPIPAEAALAQAEVVVLAEALVAVAGQADGIETIFF
jgi:hypothetical protein